MVETFAKDTDGFFARHFDRKISGAISQQLLKTPITPNQITVGVTLLGIWGGWLMAQAGMATKVEGIAWSFCSPRFSTVAMGKSRAPKK